MGYGIRVVDENQNELSNSDAYLYITYNYYPIFKELGIGSLNHLSGQSIMSTLPTLIEKYTEIPSEQPNRDYWKPTAGNVKRALGQLIDLGAQYPYGYWYVD